MPLYALDCIPSIIHDYAVLMLQMLYSGPLDLLLLGRNSADLARRILGPDRLTNAEFERLYTALDPLALTGRTLPFACD